MVTSETQQALQQFRPSIGIAPYCVCWMLTML
jgi:hypothetical protein